MLEQHFVPIRVGDRETSRLWVTATSRHSSSSSAGRHACWSSSATPASASRSRTERLRELDELKTGVRRDGLPRAAHAAERADAATWSCCSTTPAGALSDEQRQIAAAAKRGADRLARLVDDLLVLAQLQSRSLRIDRGSVDVPAT